MRKYENDEAIELLTTNQTKATHTATKTSDHQNSPQMDKMQCMLVTSRRTKTITFPRNFIDTELILNSPVNVPQHHKCFPQEKKEEILPLNYCL